MFKFLVIIVLFFGISYKTNAQSRICLYDEQNKAIQNVEIKLFSIQADSLLATGKSSIEACIDLTAQLTSHIKYKIRIYKNYRMIYIDTIELKKEIKLTIPLFNQIKKVVVTSQIKPVSADSTINNITIINRKRIEAQASPNLTSLLSNELNIRLSNDPVLGSQMSLNGLSGQHVKILRDGIPIIGRQDGNLDLSQINLNNVKQIEIVQGPQSAIYGTDAIGGVINIISIDQFKPKLGANLNYYTETVGTHNLGVNLNLKRKKVNYWININRNFFDGFDPNEDEKKRWVQWKPRTQIFGDLGIKLRLKKGWTRFLLSAMDEEIFNFNLPNVTPYAVNAIDQIFKTRRIDLNNSSTFFIKNDVRLKTIVGYNHFQRIKLSQYKDLVTGEQNFLWGNNRSDTSAFNLWMSRSTLSKTLNKNIDAQIGYDLNYENALGKRIEDETQQIFDVGFFYNANYKLGRKVKLNQGMRYIYNSRYEAPIINNFNLRFDFAKSWNTKISLAEGFRSPSLKEFSLYFVDINHNIRGNKDLKAEKARNLQISIEHKKKFKNSKILLSSSGFYNHLKDMISLALVENQNQLYSYINIDEFQTFGFRFNSNIQTKRLNLNLGYANVARDFSQRLGQNAIAYSSEVQSNFTYKWLKPNIQFNMFYKYTGKAPGFSLNANNELQTFSIAAFHNLDANVSKPIFKSKVKVSLGIKNLTNTTNILSGSASSSSAHSSNTSLPIAMGRFFFGSFKYDIQ